jgi:DNA-binding PadR family transcriptional regulator
MTSVGFFWKASHQQIYRELTQLEGKGWVELTEAIRKLMQDQQTQHLEAYRTIERTYFANSDKLSVERRF